MERSTAQILNGLIPTITGPLPPGLFELAVSLLAQSRSKASSLKADEEIARAYACANIACERLKQKLALPKIEPRPPCPPKVYQKLYKYLDSVLPTGSGRITRQSSQNNAVSIAASSPAKRDRPAKAAHLRPTTPKRPTPQRLGISATSEVSAWVMPVIRTLCKKLGAPAAPHHIFAGVCSIISSQEATSTIKPKDIPNKVKLPALIVAVYLLVVTRLAGVKTSPGEYLRQKNLALETVMDPTTGDPEEKSASSGDIDACMRQVRDQRWTEMDWFSNIEAGSGVGIHDGRKEEEESTTSDDDTEKGPIVPGKTSVRDELETLDGSYLQAGLGTMMQDRVDYLSDERRRSYKEWKKGILIRIEELNNNKEMDTESG